MRTFPALSLVLLATGRLTRLVNAGLWLGLTVALTFTGVSSTWICWRINWEYEAEQTRIRLGEGKRDEEEE